MGVKKGQFVSKNGHTYEVRLSGTNVGNADILLGVPPVVISMAAGEHKFCGFKSTTAVVNILTDVPLIDLYASGVRDIRLTVEDKTASTLEFDGYVTPFAFDQPYTGKLDSVQVNAVDLLTARKDVPYSNIGTPHGTDRSGLEIIQGICDRVGIGRIVLHLNFNTPDDVMAYSSPLDVMVAQAGFLQDEMTDADALSSVCKFFGYTAHVIGVTLYLYDESCLCENSDANVYVRKSDKWELSSHYYHDSSSLLSSSTIDDADISNDISVSIERAYDGIQITPEGAEESVLLPDVCSDDELFPDGKYPYQEVYNKALITLDGDEYGNVAQYRESMGNDYMTFGATSDAGPTDYAESPFSEDNTWDGAAIAEGVYSYRYRSDKYPYSEVDSEPSCDVSEVKIVAVRGQEDDVLYNVGMHNRNRAMSHTGGYISVKLNIDVSRRSYWVYRMMPWREESSYAADAKKYSSAMFALKCGDYVLLDENTWKHRYSTSDRVSLYFYQGEIGASKLGAKNMRNEFIVHTPSAGQILIDLQWKGYPFNTQMYQSEEFLGYKFAIETHILGMSIKGVGDDIDLDNEQFKHKYSDGSDILDVSTHLTTRCTPSAKPRFGVNARAGVVIGGWNGSHLLAGGGMEGSGILMAQLKARYGQPHAAYKMTADGNIKPFAAVEWNGTTYTVEAYDRDLYDDTTTITID